MTTSQVRVESPDDVKADQWLWATVGTVNGPALTIAGAATVAGAPLVQWSQQWGPDGSPAAHQQWQYVNLDGNYFKFVSRSTGMVLSVVGARKENGAAVIQEPWTGRDNQIWSRQYPPGGGLMMINKNSGKALDVADERTGDGVVIIQWTPHQGKNQTWNTWHV